MSKNTKQDPTPQGRRHFLKSTGIMMGALGVMALSRPAVAVEPPAPVPQKWNTTVDVLIIGTGFAGLAAAIEARNAQANVLIIEKMPLFGENSILNGGDLSAARLQHAAGAGHQGLPRTDVSGHDESG